MLDASRYYLFTELMTHDTRMSFSSRPCPRQRAKLDPPTLTIQAPKPAILHGVKERGGGQSTGQAQLTLAYGANGLPPKRELILTPWNATYKGRNETAPCGHRTFLQLPWESTPA